MKKGKGENEMVSNRKKQNENNKQIVTAQYECTKNCRACPFPGAKCTENPEFLRISH